MKLVDLLISYIAEEAGHMSWEALNFWFLRPSLSQARRASCVHIAADI